MNLVPAYSTPGARSQSAPRRGQVEIDRSLGGTPKPWPSAA